MKKFKIITLTVLSIAILIGGVILYRSLYNKSIQGALENTQTIKAEDTPANKDLEEVNKLITLPYDSSEVVYFGKIKDIDSLKGKQEFFKKAKNGDLLIVYPDQTIIYDPLNKTVVDIAKVRLFK